MKKILIFTIFLLTICFANTQAATVGLNTAGEDYNSQCFGTKSYLTLSTIFMEYDEVDTSTLKGKITAYDLKPYMTYQVKLLGKPTCLYGTGGNDLANENIGLKGRWTCTDCDGTALERNRVDSQYYANSHFRGDASECIQGYVVFDFITADAAGYAQKDIESDSSYHVLWCNGAVCGSASNSFLPADSYMCPADKVEGQIERGSCGAMAFEEGVYDVVIAITEESFHKDMCWATVMKNDNMHFEIAAEQVSGELDFLDIGNSASETLHNALDFDPIEPSGGYGGKDATDVVDDEGAGNAKDMKVVIKGLECNDITEEYATFELVVPQGKVANNMQLRALNGVAGADSFDVFVNNNFVYHYNDGDSQGGSETWSTLEIPLEDLTGTLTVKIIPTEPAWASWWGSMDIAGGCGVYGQLTFSWAMIYGVEADTDGDGFLDSVDNCPNVANPNQADLDKDGIGNDCDNDADGDTYLTSDEPFDCNDMNDAVYPGAAEICGDSIDQDCNGADLACAPIDTDEDGVPDSTDNCPSAINPSQADADNDGLGDACDTPVAGPSTFADIGSNGQTCIDVEGSAKPKYWGIPAVENGAYGGEPYSNFCLVWEPGCTSGKEFAAVALHLPAYPQTLSIRHLDGLSGLDSFEVYIETVDEDLYVGTWNDATDDHAENWVITEFDLASLNLPEGDYGLDIKAIDSPWAECNSWGQVAVDWISATQKTNGGGDIPEFTVIGALAALGLAGIYAAKRRKN
ncbi:MAG: thrombospondin type 3 repeat-containing protein [archaeon]